MNDNFYRAFEDVHRGSRQDIMRRLQVYLPFVLPVVQINTSAVVLDLGCGRGEWLELLAEQGLQAQGIDLDEGMLQAARSQGLIVRHADAIEALQNMADGTASVVSAFHLVEHLTFNNVQQLIEQARRVLVPGGLLILETPNPDNLRVASSNFHLDPSHNKPIPSALLSFIAGHAGFARSKVLGLQENPGLRFQQNLELQDVLEGASPDYAVIAQKAFPPDQADPLSHLFERTYGISTAELAQAYSHQQSQALKALRLENHDLRLQITETKLELQAARLEWDSQVQAIHDSAIWRISRPLQWLFNQYRRLRQEGVAARIRALWHKLMRKAPVPAAPQTQAPAPNQRQSERSKTPPP